MIQETIRPTPGQSGIKSPLTSLPNLVKGLGVSCALTASMATHTTAQEAPAQRPNVVFFLVDDMGWKDLGCYGSTSYSTPNIDNLAKGGIRFTQAYAACPVCAPTRHSILSGKYPGRSGCTSFWMDMTSEETTLAETLKTANYANYFLGKWHLGYTPETLPTGQGFDVNIGGYKNGQPSTYYYPYTSKKYNGRFDVRGLQEGGTPGEYLTDRLGDEAVKLLKTHDRKKPFLLYLAFYSVHAPIEGRPDLVENYKKELAKKTFTGEAYKKEGSRNMKQWQDSPGYAAMVQSVDDNVGKIIAALDELKQRKNTVVFFMSDNGGVAHVNNATANRPLRAAKGWLYEGGIREPMIVNWSARIKPGVCDVPVISTDFYPTILDLVGLDKKPEQHIDGVSFKPLLDGSSTYKPRPLFWHYPHNHGAGSKAAAAIRSGNYKLIEFLAEAGKASELYDLSTDIGETKNLASSKPEIAARLQKQLDDWQTRVNAPPYVPGKPKNKKKK